MSGTHIGGKKTAATNKKRFGPDYYKKIGHIGGSRSRKGGFASTKVGKDGLTGPERARLMGAKGGRVSRRGPKKQEAQEPQPEPQPAPQPAPTPKKKTRWQFWI